jgi:hypothetical protein
MERRVACRVVENYIVVVVAGPSSDHDCRREKKIQSTQLIALFFLPACINQ